MELTFSLYPLIRSRYLPVCASHISFHAVLIGAEIGQRYSFVVRLSFHLHKEICTSLACRFRLTNLLITIVCLILPRGFASDLLRTGIRSLPPGLNYSDFTNLAVLRYAGAPDGNPTADPTVNIPVSQMPLVETNLHVSVLKKRGSTNADVLSI